jgi:hypothetical protein
MLSSWASSAIQRGANSRKSVEEILANDELYQDKKTKAARQIETSKKALAKLEPKLERIESILSSVGC